MYDSLLNELAATTVLPPGILAMRLAGAVLLCGLIGFERESRARPAGLRTHMLVGLAAAVYCILMLELMSRGDSYAEGARMDPIRVIEAVTSGVAFLAAGLIVFSQGKVHGLTTGASLWLTASVGLACGLGLWVVAVLVTVPAITIIWLVGIAERKLAPDKRQNYDSRSG
ncbi:MgtC/SapB family protein [Maritimibacter sp. UBA3975]|uniref:MgtC/SapB family protein n=1 Tax=Maritimibacter sp. UBA3975 TaxID=1946833 RepID=UPI000C0B4C0D|nr:MgtC/SapB family protein [Maritimibacter sp. UBA3975]MAM63706.1 preprotein translocase subunit TatA [Maritimibacter sp.]|tara:strand:+ start:14392 stop:14901 length:510 start_codon:yes stop_codon:yes gene_type:complete